MRRSAYRLAQPEWGGVYLPYTFCASRCGTLFGSKVITDFNQVTVGWMEACLCNSGALVNGNVAGVDALPSAADNSRNAKIAVMTA